MQTLIGIKITIQSRSKRNKGLLDTAFSQLKRLEWLKDQYYKRPEPNKETSQLLKSIYDLLVKNLNKFKTEYDNEKTFYETWMQLGKWSARDPKLRQLLTHNLEFFKKLKLHSWDNEHLDPDLLIPIYKIVEKIVEAVEQSSTKIDLYTTVFKFMVYPTTYKPKDPAAIIKMITDAMDRCKACNFIYIIEQINAKKVVDRTKRDYDLNWLIEILNNLEKIPSKLKPGVKRILDMLRVIIGKLRELLKKDGKLDIPGDIEKELIDVFRIVDNVDDSNFPVDAQLIIHDSIRILIKLIIEIKKQMENDGDEDPMKPSNDLADEIEKLTNSDLNIFDEETKKKLKDILDAHKKIEELMKKGKDKLTEDEIKEIIRLSGIIKNNVDSINSEKKLPTAIHDMLKEFGDLAEDRIEEMNKLLNDRKKENLDNAVQELKDIYDGPDEEIINQIEEKKKCIMDFYAQINEIGIEALTTEELNELKKCQEDLNNLIDSLKKKKPPPSQDVLDALDKIKDAMDKIDDSIKDKKNIQEIEDRREVTNEISKEPTDGLGRECIAALQIVQIKLPIYNKFIENILINGIDSSSPEDINKIKELHSQIDRSVNVLTSKQCKISPGLRDALEKVKEYLDKNEKLINNKQAGEKIKQKDEEVNNIIDNLGKDDKNTTAKIDDAKTKGEEKIKDLQNKYGEYKAILGKPLKLLISLFFQCPMLLHCDSIIFQLFRASCRCNKGKENVHLKCIRDIE